MNVQQTGTSFLRVVSETLSQSALNHFRFLLNKIKPHILELPLSKKLIYQASSFTLRCRDDDKMMKGCNYCMMTIPCQCTVIGNNMQFDQKIV